MRTENFPKKNNTSYHLRRTSIRIHIRQCSVRTKWVIVYQSHFKKSKLEFFLVLFSNFSSLRGQTDLQRPFFIFHKLDNGKGKHSEIQTLECSSHNFTSLAVFIFTGLYFYNSLVGKSSRKPLPRNHVIQ